MMPRFAIDVVILPPEPVMDLALSWNQQLSGQGNQSIILNKTDTLPHISLLMGCVTGDQLPNASRILNEFAQLSRALSLSVPGLRTLEGSHPVVALDISLSTDLLEFQRAMVEAFRPWITQDAGDTDLFDPPPADPSVLTWINQFIPEQCGEKFWPHITLGHGRPLSAQKAFTFSGARLAICHLGHHCTCRHVLAEAILK